MDVEAVLHAERQELVRLQRRHRDLFVSGESGVIGGPARAAVDARSAVIATPADPAAIPASISAAEFAKFQESFAKVNEMNERIISQNVLLQAELEGLARMNAELRSEKAALAMKLRRAS
jgi:hypothetical protein